MNPGDFLKHPFDSVFQNIEDEIVARNIMAILSRTGNTFRNLSWKEYKQERLLDGEFSEQEKESFDRVVHYCTTEKQAKSFSRAWR